VFLINLGRFSSARRRELRWTTLPTRLSAWNTRSWEKLREHNSFVGLSCLILHFIKHATVMSIQRLCGLKWISSQVINVPCGVLFNYQRFCIVYRGYWSIGWWKLVIYVLIIYL